jgi:hypothetical protein
MGPARATRALLAAHYRVGKVKKARTPTRTFVAAADG